MKEMKLVMKLCGQTTEAFIKALAYTKGVDIVHITEDKRTAVVEMSEELSDAFNGVLFQVC